MKHQPSAVAVLARLIFLAGTLLPASGTVLAQPGAEKPTIEPLMRVVDLNVGQQRAVKLADGKTTTVKLLDLQETRDKLRNAVRQTRVKVELDGRIVTLPSATYHLPITVGRVQIDCPITKGHVQPGSNPWALDADVRLRLWPAPSPWIRPGTFGYPATQRWFASGTLMANEIGDGERTADKSIYYHWGLDIGGAERMVDVLAATDGEVVAAGEKVLQSARLPSTVNPRYDVVYIRDGRGWYYRYSHLDSIDPSVRVGIRVKLGQKIGILGKEGASGGWSHLHFDVAMPQPSGRYGITDGYAFFWQAYHRKHKTKLQAVARPHQLTWTGDPVTLDGTRSWSVDGPEHIVSYEWTFTDKTTAAGQTVQRRYDRPGTYSEILKISDDRGRIDYDFSVVQVVDRKTPNQQAPSLHAAYSPTFNIKAGDEVTFKVRSFRVDRDEGHEEWDFGDGSPPVKVQSDGNASAHAKDGYAVATHRYRQSGHYLVTVQRTNRRGETGFDHLHVLVGPR